MMELESNKNILVLGSKGMLGNSIFSYLGKNTVLSIFGTTSKEEIGYTKLVVDKDYLLSLEKIFSKNKYDYVINCIGSIRPINTIEEYNKTLLINSHFPKSLQKLSCKYDFKLIHFSTDCVFDGLKGNYGIEDIPNEFDLYGLSKYLGEIDDSKNLTIRTSIIGLELGNNNKNLLNWFLSNKDGDEVLGYSKVFWNGLTTLTIAKILERIILDSLDIKGIIQLANNEKLSKYELLNIFKEVYNLDITLVKDEKIISDKTIVPSEEQEIFSDLILPFREQIYELKAYYNN